MAEWVELAKANKQARDNGLLGTYVFVDEVELHIKADVFTALFKREDVTVVSRNHDEYIYEVFFETGKNRFFCLMSEKQLGEYRQSVFEGVF